MGDDCEWPLTCKNQGSCAYAPKTKITRYEGNEHQRGRVNLHLPALPQEPQQ